jgi:hypothetical protein
MAAEVLLVGVAKVALEQGVRFLYEQAGEVLTAWRARRRDPAAPGPALLPPPADVTVGAPRPGKAMPGERCPTTGAANPTSTQPRTRSLITMLARVSGRQIYRARAFASAERAPSPDALTAETM